MYELFAGPMVWLAFALFLGGLVLQGARFFRMTGRRALPLPPSPPPPLTRAEGRAARGRGRGLARLLAVLRGPLATTHPAMTLVTVTFHVLVLVTPLFVFAHNEMIRRAVGLSLPGMNEGVSDLLTVVVVLCLGLFLLRRVFLGRLRAISSAYDYFVLLVTAAPFVTGFVAFHQLFEYRTVLLVHVVAGEVLLVLLPWTRLGHALFFFLYRFFIPSEHGFGRGRRAWQPSAAGR